MISNKEGLHTINLKNKIQEDVVDQIHYHTCFKKVIYPFET